MLLGRDLRLRRFTPAAEKAFNLRQADIGRPLADIRFSFDVPNLEALAHEAHETMQVREQEVRDREGRWHLLRIRSYCTADDRIEGSVVSLLDIDDIKRLEQRTREAADYAEAIVGTVREPLLVLDGDLRVQSANATFYRTFKVNAEDTENRLLYEVGDGQWDIPELRSLLEEILPRDETVEGYEVEHDFLGIGSRTMLLNASTLRQKEGKTQLILLAIEDVTERQRAQALERADRQKDEFLAMLAHELRNPLAAVSSAVELLGAPGGAAHLEMGRKIIGRQTAQLVRLVEDLLDVSRITRGVVSLRKEVLDAATVIRRAAETVDPLMEQRRHDLKVCLPKEPLWLEGDAARLEQVVANLLTNSAKYTEPGGRVEVKAKQLSDTIVITVRDNGIGISADLLPEVFELFSQSDRSADRTAGGLGIGLTLVRSIAELHGGSVEAKSGGLRKGSEFTVHLPALAEDEKQKPARRRSDRASAFPARRILVVDDNQDAALALSHLLEGYGHTVHQAHGGPSSLEAAALRKPHAILLDIGLPGLNGYDVAKRLRQDPDLSHILLIAISGYCQEEDRQRSRAAGFDHHLAKPTDHRELLALLSEGRGAATEVSS